MRLSCRAVYTPLTLFSHDFPPERGVLFDLICLKSSDFIKSVPPGLLGLAGWCCLLVHLSSCSPGQLECSLECYSCLSPAIFWEIILFYLAFVEVNLVNKLHLFQLINHTKSCICHNCRHSILSVDWLVMIRTDSTVKTEHFTPRCYFHALNSSISPASVL